MSSNLTEIPYCENIFIANEGVCWINWLVSEAHSHSVYSWKVPLYAVVCSVIIFLLVPGYSNNCVIKRNKLCYLQI